MVIARIKQNNAGEARSLGLAPGELSVTVSVTSVVYNSPLFFSNSNMDSLYIDAKDVAQSSGQIQNLPCMGESFIFQSIRWGYN